MDTPLEHLSDEDRAEMDQAVYASFGRMMTGAPAPPGTVTIAATDRDDFRRQFHDLFGTGDEDHGEPAPDADPVRAPGAGDGPAPGAR